MRCPPTNGRLLFPPVVGAALLLAAPLSAAFDIDPAVDYFVGIQPSGMAIGDFDGDFDLDLATTVDGPDRVVVLLNDGTGAYSLGPSTLLGSSSSPQDAIAGNFNGDEFDDLAVAVRDPNGAVLIMLGDGDGTFTISQTVLVGDRPRGLDIGDHDGDFDLDLAVANRDSDNAHVLTNNGSGSFTAAMLSAGAEPRGTAFGHFFGEDDDLDLAVTNHDDATVSIYTNTGGVFTFMANLSVGGVVRPDGIASADLDGNGFDDLAVATSDQDLNINQATIFTSTGASFNAPLHYATGGSNTSELIAVDLNCDDLPDLVTCNEDSNNLSLLENLGGAVFGPASLMATGLTPGELAAGDMDDDGDDDFAVANRDSNDVSVYINQTCVTGAAALPESFAVTRGNLSSGGLADLFASDNQYVRINALRYSEIAVNSVEIEITGTAIVDDPSEISLTVEAASSGFPVFRKTEMFNYDAGTWELVDQREGSPADASVTIDVVSNAQRFVEPGTGAMKARIGYLDRGVTFVGWDGRFDEVFWFVTP